MKGRISIRWVSTLVLLIPAILHLFPILYIISISLKSPAEVFAFPPSLIPDAPGLANYSKAFEVAPLGRFLVNSMIVSLAVTLLQLLTSIWAAFALARLEFLGKNIILGLVVATMMVPAEVTIIPNYMTIIGFGWLDHYIAMIAPFSASGFGVFLLYQFFKSIPKELEEAVIVDGASRFRFLWQFVVPLSMPAIVAFGVYSFISTWNQYLWPLIVTQSTDMRTVQVGISMFRSENESSSWGIIMAATTILIVPSIAIFVATQKQFVRGITMSGIKG